MDLPIAECYIGLDAAQRMAAFAAARCGATALVVSDENTREAGGAPVLKALSSTGKTLQERIFGREAINASEVLGDDVKEAAASADFIVGLGSGTLCDLAKYAGDKLGKPVLLFATAASMNGYTSGIVALTVRGVKRTQPCHPAVGVFADPEVVAAAPQRMTAAGTADFLSKCSSSADWRVAHFLRDEYHDENTLQFYEGILDEILNTTGRIGAGDAEAVALVLEALHLSGLSMLLAGSSAPASGGEHLISHYIDMKHACNGTPHDLHGVQVGVASIHCLRLWEKVQALDPDAFDVAVALDAQPTMEQVRARVESDWGPVAGEVMAQWEQKALDRDAMRTELTRLRRDLPELSRAVRNDLLPAATIAEAIRTAGGPVEPEGMTVPVAVYHDALRSARFIRNRFTILDLADELCIT
jgi:glycerol-1-phosphate dehydrogenase [NAD(P)+]